MKAADIDSDQFVAAIAVARAFQLMYGRTLGLSRWLLPWLFPAVPEKVLLAKVRILIRQNRLQGCGCGCRGDLIALAP